MARGIILSKKRRKAVILMDDGRFRSVRLRKSMSSLVVGQSVNDVHLVSRKFLKMPLFIASGMIFVVLLFIGHHVHQNRLVAAYVSFDLNPSIEAAVNRHLDVLSVDAMNDEAQDLLHDTNYTHMSLQQFTNKMAEALIKANDVKKNANIVISTTLAMPLDKVKREQLNRKITFAVASLNQQLFSDQNQGHFKLVHATLAKRNAANKIGLTAGKYLMYKALMDKGHHITITEAKEMPIQDMRTELLDSEAAQNPSDSGWKEEQKGAIGGPKQLSDTLSQ
ncbi:hypothetical protein GCM10011391_29000 [Pullulanibacillus camelliae]|uniref:RsgI N-terminal anti-sigma domain-containing protein n=1 Tax=Pullulanibacillus camelliae TaxID=1707096 RepID=A0A8J3DVV2_9BACL|nr:anti-sigma factor domain-containing protein [Pullulanibacillus camelliae]GGE48401.1 hypothetical protein GCM10011391_29000 [Pullulanibacillus camelliae]